MSDPNGFPVLAINVGSSSLKFALFRLDPAEITLVSGRIQRIGAEGGRIRAVDVEGSVVLDEQAEFADHESAVERVLSCFDQLRRFPKPRAIGHRIVHGGPNYWRPQRVTRNLINALNDWVSLDPDHLPQEIRAIEAVGRKFPELPQVACFDTAFHRAMPRVAQTVPLPAEYRREGIVRYGFHGLSYEYILARLRAEAGEATAGGRVIIAHLGSGASMAAVDKGRPVETTMGLTPLGGLVLSTRCGDLDPGVVLYLLQQQSVSPDAIDDLLNHRAGLLGVSGTTGDMQELLAREETDSQAAEAVELVCYRARSFNGGLCASLGGLDTLTFTGGIGENAPRIRKRILAGLDFLGVRIDDARNDRNEPIVSPDGDRVTVRVMPTNEELMIARHVGRLLAEARNS